LLHPLQCTRSILLAAFHELAEWADLGFARRDDPLATLLIRHMLGAAPVVEPLSPLNAETRLERVGWVVDPGVNDSAISRRGLASCSRMTLEKANAKSRVGQVQRNTQTHYACTDNKYIEVIVASSKLHAWSVLWAGL
jgi:hypothetical protein